MSKIETGIARLVLGASILAATGSAFAAPTLNLPPNPPGPYTANLTFKSDFSLGSYFTAVFGTPAIPVGLDVVQGVTYKAWCVEFADDILFNPVDSTTYTATGAGPFTFRDTTTLTPGTLPLDADSPNWGAVNWLLNNKGSNSVQDIQEAIWFLLNGAYFTQSSGVPTIAPTATSDALVNAALAHTSFVPGVGQIEGVLLDGGDGLKNDQSDVQSLLIEVTVPPAGTGCPATQGFWHKASRSPNFTKVVDGVTYNGGTGHTMVIGGITYTEGQLLALLPSGSLHTGGYVNALSQFIAAVLNLSAGAKNGSVDATVSAINTDLAGVTFVTGDGSAAHPYKLVPISASLQNILTGFEQALDNYNSAVGMGCGEGSGLLVGN